MDWTFITTYPLASLSGAALIGLIVGWFFAGLGARRRQQEAGQRLAALESKLRSSRRELDDAKHEARAAADTTHRAHSEEVAALQAKLAELRTFQETTVAEPTGAGAPAATEQGASDALQTDLAAAQQLLQQKDAALDAAFARAAQIQQQFNDTVLKLAAAEAEIDNLQFEVSNLSQQRDEAEARIQRARGEVAGEMALLTSTMVKLREDSLSQANARIAALTQELDTLRNAGVANGAEQPA